MSVTLSQINLDEVDGGDRSFVVSFGFDLAPLQAAIETLGLLSPPLLRPRPDGRYQIVCGYQRFLAVTQLGWPELPVLLVPAETPAVWCLQASLQDTVSGRGFNPMEAALMIDRLLGHFDEDTVRRQYLPLLGLPPSLPHLRRAQSLLQLEAPWQEFAAHHRLSTEAAAVLSQWSGPERGALLPWFQSLHFSHSKQLELLEYLVTLSRRAGNSPIAWLEHPELVSLLADPVLSRSEKSNRLGETLRHWCFPRATQAQRQFQHSLKALGLSQHPEIRLIPSLAFEDSSLKLELRFRDRAQLARHLQQVQEMLDQPAFEALLQL